MKYLTATARPRDLARQVRRHPSVRPRRPASPPQAVAAPLCPRSPHHDRQAEIRFNATEAILNPLLRSYGPWGSGAHVSYPYGRFVNDGLWYLPDRAHLLEPLGEADQEVHSLAASLSILQIDGALQSRSLTCRPAIKH
jgi:hypothetical protein